ncbi:MAG: hypothetical protein ACI861_001885, partial [Paracoccaceae bacterium]
MNKDQFFDNHLGGKERKLFGLVRYHMLTCSCGWGGTVTRK